MYVIGDCTHDFFVMRGMCCAPSILAILYLVSSRYMVPSFLRSFKAFLSCFSIHLR